MTWAQFLQSRRHPFFLCVAIGAIVSMIFLFCTIFLAMATKERPRLLLQQTSPDATWGVRIYKLCGTPRESPSAWVEVLDTHGKEMKRVILGNKFAFEDCGDPDLIYGSLTVTNEIAEIGTKLSSGEVYRRLLIRKGPPLTVEWTPE